MVVLSTTLTLSPEANIFRYLQEIKKFPMLTPEDELKLAKRWTMKIDDETTQQMINSRLRLVAKIAMGYRGYGLPVGEPISKGNIGMMQAVNRSDPDKGFRLATYAMWWIQAAI